MQTHAFAAMGCQIRLVLDRSDDLAATALSDAAHQIATWEQQLSRFRLDSELSALNRHAGTGWTPVSPTLWAALTAARWAARASAGLVTPTVLTALEQAGYDRDFAALADVTEAGSAPAPAAASVWWQLRIDRQRRAVALPHGMRLDLGGSVKGWAADRTAHHLGISGPALADLGGDIAVSGPRSDGSPWAIAVADPTRPAAELDLLLLPRGSVATSGRDWRRWRQGGRERHHIIDPRTGEPAASDLLSVTIVAPFALAAETAAKLVFILGRDAGLAWLAQRPALAGLLVDANGSVVRTASLESYRFQAQAAAASSV